MLLVAKNHQLIEAGCDEAGRGCLAGPVFAAAVILPKGFSNELLNDSKKLSEKKRDELRPMIEEQTYWAVASCSPIEIDKHNILQASIMAMHRALNILVQKYTIDYILVDGNRFKKYKDIPHECVVKGDGKYMSIAAASILAKTHRDEYMLKIHHEFPMFEWNANKGYPTAHHRKILQEKGATVYHRKTFGPVAAQLQLFNK